MSTTYLKPRSLVLSGCMLLNFLVTAGCGSLHSSHADQLVIAHKHGYPINLERQEVKAKDFANYVKPILERIDQYMKSTAGKGAPRLLIHVHGGMNTYRGALARVDELLLAQQDGRHEHLAKHHLLFVNWDSSLPTSVADDLLTLRLGEEHPIWGPISSPFITASRLASSGFSTPQSLAVQLVNARDALWIRESEPWPWSECALAPLGDTSDRWVPGNAALFVTFYLIRALTVPVIQGFGTPAWDTMKRRAELVLAPRRGISLARRDGQGTARLLLDALRARMKAPRKWHDENGKEVGDLAITLVGHSMGTMILNNVLEDYTDLSFDRIVYLAAAASIDDVRGAVLPYLRNHPETKFWGFSLSETREALEWDYFDMFDRGTLLVWIDHYFQRVNAPGDRVFGRGKELRQYFEIPQDLRDRFFLVKFGNGRHDPKRHGDFSKTEILERVLQIVDGEGCPRR